MALHGVVVPNPVNRGYLSQRWKAIRALKSWTRHCAEGGTETLEEHARQGNFRISARVIRRVLRDDPQVHGEIFGELTTEAKLGLKRVLDQLNAQLSAGDLPAAVLIRMGEFFAKYAGDMFTAKEASAGAGVAISINLPPDARTEPIRIEAVQKAKESLGGYLE